jgi:hypothetical protein
MPENNNVLNPTNDNTEWVIAGTQAGATMPSQTISSPDNPVLPGQGPLTETANKPSGLWAKLKYAFAVEDESFNKFSEEEMSLLNKVADIVIKRRLAAPALMFLESVRPLNFLGSQVIVFFEPIVAMVISTKELGMFAQILEKRKSIPLLIDLIEKKDDALRADSSK